MWRFSLILEGNILASSNTVNKLGVVIHQDMPFNAHIKQICRPVFIHLHNITKMRNIRLQSDTEKLVVV